MVVEASKDIPKATWIPGLTMSLLHVLRTYKRPWIDRQQVYFAIIHTPRSGSNYLAELLDSADNVTCHTEIFSPKATYLSRQSDVPYIDKETRDRDLWGFLRRLIVHASGSKAFGFKIGLYDHRAMLAYVLFSRRVKKLVVRRRNLLAAFVSAKEAERSGAWIRWRDVDDTSDQTAKIHLSLGEFYVYALKTRLFYLLVRIIGWVTLQTFLWVVYEDMKKEAIRRQLSEGLDVDLNGRERTEKQSKRPIRDRLENIAQVERSMRRINAGWMLNENG